MLICGYLGLTIVTMFYFLFIFIVKNIVNFHKVIKDVFAADLWSSST